jgi:hypothetical protein
VSVLLRCSGAVIRGERHGARGEPCCDALWIAPRRAPLAGFVICDGAGGTPAVARAASAACRSGYQALLLLHRQLRSRLARGEAAGLAGALESPALKQRFLAAFRHRGATTARRCTGADHTLLACLWDRQLLLVARVGDCSLLLRQGGLWQLPLPPAHGTYANETCFLRPGTPTADLALWCTATPAVEALIGFSDGLEAAFLAPLPAQPQQLQPNQQLAELVHGEHRRRRGWRSYRPWLERSLAEPAIAALSDDDRSLVISSR